LYRLVDAAHRRRSLSLTVSNLTRLGSRRSLTEARPIS
jgi:hypothetical protein